MTTEESLTSNEVQILKLLAQGLSNKQIAQQLFVSCRTVETNNHRIYTKLKVRNRTEAMIVYTKLEG